MQLDEERLRQALQGARLDGPCLPEVKCDLCGGTGDTKIVSIRRNSSIRYLYVCENCLAKAGFVW
jgi:hypothetical protein